MQIVIDIPDEQYEFIKRSDKNAFATVSSKECMLYAIKNGTVLPKEHGDLIDINNIESIMLEDSLDRMVHIKGDEVDWYIEAPILVEADK